MNKLADLIRREPVRVFVALDILTAWIVNGLVLWDVWQPTDEQLAWVNGTWVTVAAAFGFTIVRQAVTPNPTVDILTEQAWLQGASDNHPPGPL